MKIRGDVPLIDSWGRIRLFLSDRLSDLANQINGVSEGNAASFHNAGVVPPTTGRHAKGDFLRNADVQELGVAGSKYIIVGWYCVIAGSPGVWVPSRTLTGN